MTGSDDLRGLEYSALMGQVRDLDRTAQWGWLAAVIAAAALTSSGIGARSAGLMLPAVLCAAFGYYTFLRGRRKSRLIEGYIQEFFEKDRDGAKWHTRLAQLATLPGVQDSAEWMPLTLSNLVTLVAVVLSWTFAETSPRGEFMAGFTTMTGVAFAVHSIVESMRTEQTVAASGWPQVSGALREVSTTGSDRRFAGSGR
jgi:EamA domain-containing membrane protein RarD